MGLFDFLRGIKRPPAGTPAAPAEDLRAALLDLNRDSAPWRVIPCDDDSCDLIAEWRIVDATWYEIFAKAGLEKVARVKLRLDPARHEVRALDEEFEISWRAGVPELHLSAQAFRGRKSEVSFGTAWAFTEELRPGQVYKYRFNSSELKTPLREVVLAHGWTWRPVAFGHL